MLVSPGSSLISSGYEGGPFIPESATYTLRNLGTTALNWSAFSVETWLDIAPLAGILDGGASTNVTVQIAGAANSLAPGAYQGLIQFDNVSSGTSQNRAAQLTVKAIPGNIQITDTITSPTDRRMPFGDVIMGLSRTEYVTVSNSDPLHSLLITNISLGGRFAEDFEDGEAQGWLESPDEDWSVYGALFPARPGRPSPCGRFDVHGPQAA